jgi:hypothetical protein
VLQRRGSQSSQSSLREPYSNLTKKIVYCKDKMKHKIKDQNCLRRSVCVTCIHVIYHGIFQFVVLKGFLDNSVKIPLLNVVLKCCQACTNDSDHSSLDVWHKFLWLRAVKHNSNRDGQQLFVAKMQHTKHHISSHFLSSDYVFTIYNWECIMKC